MTEGSFISHKWQDFEYCPGYYDLNADISFDVPPASIIGDDEIVIKANGTMTGTRDCCYIGASFKYGVYCENGSGYSISADSEEKKIVEVWGSSGTTVNYSDDLEIKLILPGISSSATKCVITGYAYSSVTSSVKWTYYPTDVHLPSTYIEKASTSYDTPGDEVIIFVKLVNPGGTDSGTIKVTGEILYWSDPDENSSDKIIIDTSSPYTIGEQEERMITIKIPVAVTQQGTSTKFSQTCDEFPKGILWSVSLDRLTVEMLSDSGITSKANKVPFSFKCSEILRQSVLDIFLGPLSTIIRSKKENWAMHLTQPYTTCSVCAWKITRAICLNLGTALPRKKHASLI